MVIIQCSGEEYALKHNLIWIKIVILKSKFPYYKIKNLLCNHLEISHLVIVFLAYFFFMFWRLGKKK